MRITDDDAEFLAEFEAPGARTPSEKVRAILAGARKRHEGVRDFATCMEVVEDMLRPALHNVRAAQQAAGTRSDFVLRLYERMPEVVAELVAADPGRANGTGGTAALVAFEASLADVVFALIEEILDMGLTSRSKSYDPALIWKRLESILEVLELLKVARKTEKGESNA